MQPSLSCLQTDVLVHLLSYLTCPKDLIAARLACKRLCSVSRHGSLWRGLCCNTWHTPGSILAQAGSWERLFITCNGLLSTDVHAEVLQLPVNAGDAGACLAGVGNTQGQVQVAIGHSNTVDIITLSSCLHRHSIPTSATSSGTPNAARDTVMRPTAYHCLHLPEPHKLASAVAWCDDGSRLLVGTSQGMVYMYNSQWDSPSGGVVPVSSTPQAPAAQWHPQQPLHQHSTLPVADIIQTGTYSLPATRTQATTASAQQTAACTSATAASGGLPIYNTTGHAHGYTAILHDSYWCSSLPDGGQHYQLMQHARNVIHLYSSDLEHHLGQVHDIMEAWQFVCMAGVGRNSPAELAVGSTAGPSCNACWNDGNPWMCWHKPRVRSAALCMLDVRLPGFISARYSLQHRSMYPHLCVLRHQYVVTSHATKPICVWDLRAMSVPLFQQDWLDNCSQGPVGCCSQRPEHQGLWLTCTDDMLVGRADNGCTWAWDLSSMLGAADGSSAGLWDAAAQDASLAFGDDHHCSPNWPCCLGAVPLGSAGVPTTLLLPDSPAPTLLCLSSSHACLPDTQPRDQAEQRAYDGGSDDSSSEGDHHDSCTDSQVDVDSSSDTSWPEVACVGGCMHSSGQ